MKQVIYIIIAIGLIACQQSVNNNQSYGILIPDIEYDFGIVPDSIHVLHHTFSIINNTSDTCHIINVLKSCGCTNMNLSSSVISPRDSVFLDVNVDIGSYYSFFEKSISIYVDNCIEPFTIFIRASRKIPEQVVFHEFPLKISEYIRVSTPYIILGNVSLGKVKSEFINVLNSSDETVPLTAKIVDAPEYMHVYYPDYIKPNEIGRIIIIIDLSKDNDKWGLHEYQLTVSSGAFETKIPIVAIFTEDFTSTKEYPRILVPVSNYTVDANKCENVKFIIRNVGHSVLFIRNIQNFSENNVHINSMAILPEEQDTLSVFIDKKQISDIKIGLTTNDPIEPYKLLNIYCRTSE